MPNDISPHATYCFHYVRPAFDFPFIGFTGKAKRSIEHRDGKTIHSLTFIPSE